VFESITWASAVEVLRAHPYATPLLIFGVMVLEGVVVTTFIFSATLIILAAGAMVQAGVLGYPAVFAAIFLGLWAGDALNFGLAARGESWFQHLQVVRRHQSMLRRAEHLVSRWGLLAIFLSRFMGPTRPFVTLLAGLLKMSAGRFHLVTALSSLLLTAALMQLGMGGLAAWKHWVTR
jgi:membrane protein DedA with SNARE-associated domain